MSSSVVVPLLRTPGVAPSRFTTFAGASAAAKRQGSMSPRNPLVGSCSIGRTLQNGEIPQIIYRGMVNGLLTRERSVPSPKPLLLTLSLSSDRRMAVFSGFGERRHAPCRTRAAYVACGRRVEMSKSLTRAHRAARPSLRRVLVCNRTPERAVEVVTLLAQDGIAAAADCSRRDLRGRPAEV